MSTSPQPQRGRARPSPALDDALVGAVGGVLASAAGLLAGAVPRPAAAALAGAAYRVARRVLPTPGPPALHGSGFGLGLWLLSRPRAARRRDTASRRRGGWRALLAHLAFGAALGALVEPPRRVGGRGAALR
ncbi:MAG TPA: hypothetical protein VIK95_04265 [Egibacteraceae bacterium]